MDSSETRRLANWDLENIATKNTTWWTNIDSIMLQQEGPTHWSSKFCSASIPAWSPGCPWGGCQDQKHFEMKLRAWTSCCSGAISWQSVETLLNNKKHIYLYIFINIVCSMNNKLMVPDVRFTVLLVQAGVQPAVDASQMLPSSMIPSLWFLVHNSSSLMSLHDSSNTFWKKLLRGLRLGPFVWKPGIQHHSPNQTSHKLSQRVSIWSSHRVSK